MERRATNLVLYAFAAMVGLILLLGISAMLLLAHHRTQIQHAYDGLNLRTQLANSMRDIVRERATRLHRIVLFNDSAERTLEIQLHAALLPRFQQAATELAALLENDKEQKTYQAMVNLAAHGWRMQDQVLGLLEEGESEAALSALLNTVLPVQDEVLEQVGVFNALQRLQAQHLKESLSTQYRLTVVAGIVLSALTLLGAGLITYVLYHRVGEAERDAESARQDLQRYADQLEERVASRTRDLAKARDEAVHASQAKGMFLANISHELRTPLSAIIGYSEMMEEEAQDRSDISSIDDLRKIQHAARGLLELIDAILNMTKLEAGHMPNVIQPIALAGLAGELIDSVRPLANKNHDRLHVDLDPPDAMIESDRTKLFQILLNLLANACKFTLNGEVRLTVQGLGQDGWLFQVQDNGIGIAPDKLTQIFEPFVQADASTTRQYGGTGLGLAIAREYATLLGGRIEVVSAPGTGATFSLVLPVQAPRNAPSAD